MYANCPNIIKRDERKLPSHFTVQIRYLFTSVFDP